MLLLHRSAPIFSRRRHFPLRNQIINFLLPIQLLLGLFLFIGFVILFDEGCQWVLLNSLLFWRRLRWLREADTIIVTLLYRGHLNALTERVQEHVCIDGIVLVHATDGHADRGVCPRFEKRWLVTIFTHLSTISAELLFDFVSSWLAVDRVHIKDILEVLSLQLCCL